MIISPFLPRFSGKADNKASTLRDGAVSPAAWILANQASLKTVLADYRNLWQDLLAFTAKSFDGRQMARFSAVIGGYQIDTIGLGASREGHVRLMLDHDLQLKSCIVSPKEQDAANYVSGISYPGNQGRLMREDSSDAQRLYQQALKMLLDNGARGRSLTSKEVAALSDPQAGDTRASAKKSPAPTSSPESRQERLQALVKQHTRIPGYRKTRFDGLQAESAGKRVSLTRSNNIYFLTLTEDGARTQWQLNEHLQVTGCRKGTEYGFARDATDINNNSPEAQGAFARAVDLLIDAQSKTTR